MIKITNLNKYFNRHKANEIHVINNTNIDLPNTGFVSILGPSGCGKTTLLNAIGGLDDVDSGAIYVNGNQITKRSNNKIDEIRNINIGYIFQNYHLLDGLTVKDNVSISLRMLNYQKEDIEDRVEYVLKAVDMYRYRNRPVETLSGGQRQRVGIARALVKNPSIIIADEPTGNLDSKNSLEIMSILKSISKERLVILVTHEDDLAKFFSDRIIELVDGVIVKDYLNDNNNDLDYRLESKIYLKDLKKKNTFEKDSLSLDVYNDNCSNSKVTLIFKDGNLYIDTNLKVINTRDNSIDLVDDHYKAIDKESYNENSFDMNSFKQNKNLKYTSLFKPVQLLINGFKSLNRFSKLKKLLFVGFIFASMFILYSISNIVGLQRINEEDFTVGHFNNVEVNLKGFNSDQYEKFINELDTMDGNYIIPGDSNVYLRADLDNFYQTMDRTITLFGSLTSSEYLDKADVYGSLPADNNEIVVDKSLIFNDEFKNAGFINLDDFIGMVVYSNNYQSYKIVGITDQKTPCIYVQREYLFDIVCSFYYNDYYDLYDYMDYYNLFSIKNGSLPNNLFECIVSKDNKNKYPLNSKIKANTGKEYTVVGYYDSSYDLGFLTNKKSIQYDSIKTDKYIVSSNDKEKTISYFEDLNIEAYDVYEVNKAYYMSNHDEMIASSVILALTFLIVSLIEIYLIERSSFLSRIKEIGTLRAIGLKKKEIYKIFLSEIIAITSITSVIGIGAMAYILYNLVRVSYFASIYCINVYIILFAFILVFVFNCIVGLMPVFVTLRKTPASILKRTDAD